MTSPDELSRLEDDLARRRAGSPPPSPGLSAVSAELAGRFCNLSTASVRILVDRGLLRVQNGLIERGSLIDLRLRLDALRVLASDPVKAQVLAEEVADAALLRDPSVAAGLRALRRGDYTEIAD